MNECSFFIWISVMRTLYQLKWTLQGTILRPPDYESGALTNWAKGPILAKQEKYLKKEPIQLLMRPPDIIGVL